MGRLRRIDAELVRRKLASSREEAKQLIESGRVRLDGAEVTKPARQMDPAQAIVVDDSDLTTMHPVVPTSLPVFSTCLAIGRP